MSRRDNPQSPTGERLLILLLLCSLLIAIGGAVRWSPLARASTTLAQTGSYHSFPPDYTWPAPRRTPLLPIRPAPATPVQATPSPTATATATAAPVATLTTRPMFWGVIGDDTSQLAAERAAGITTKVVRVDWRDLFPSAGVIDQSYVAQKQAEFTTMRAAGFTLIADLGLQNSPAWVHANYPDSYYMDQYGDMYQGAVDSGDINLVFNPTMRLLAAQYIQTMVTLFGQYFSAIRIGGGPWGELRYPFQAYNGHTNAYWAFDPSALAQDPVPAWRPGQPSPHGEAAAFLNFYLQALTNYQNWQIATLRQYYSGSLMVLYPGFGIRPGQAQAAIAGNLSGTTPAEINGETQMGTDYARQVAALQDPRVIVYSTWLDCPYENDAGTDPTTWSPIKYLASLAQANPLHLPVAGENTGQGSAATLAFAVSQAAQNQLIGLVWFNEAELFSGAYATLADYQHAIANWPG